MSVKARVRTIHDHRLTQPACSLNRSQDMLVRAAYRIILENRSTIYQTEGPEAFRSHGCEPANKQVLKRLRRIRAL